MGTYSLRRFSNLETLKSIAPEHLLSLLKPHATFFAGRGMKLPAARDDLDYSRLAEILMTPDIDTPDDLKNALFFIDEMATPEGMNVLLEEADKLRIVITGDPAPTPGDVAVQMWLQNREVLERKHAEQFLTKTRSFEYYQTGASPVPKFRKPTDAAMKRLEASLNEWFGQKKRGRNCRVLMFAKDGEIWFPVRHGDPFKREGAIGQNGESSSVFYWPEKFDVLVYRPQLGEIRIHTRTKGETDLYREAFGQHLFDDPEFFPGNQKYTLEPLREQGEASLVCADVEGLESITLTEVQFYWGAHGEREIRRADDVFAAYRDRERTMPTHPRIIRATFHVLFADAKKPRTVTIKPPNVALYTRDGDSVLIEQWLTLRGFIGGQQENDDGEAEKVLADA